MKQINRQRKDDGRVLLGRDGGQGLQVAELEGGRRLGDDVGGFLQGSSGLLFTFRSDDFCPVEKKIFKKSKYMSKRNRERETDKEKQIQRKREREREKEKRVKERER